MSIFTKSPKKRVKRSKFNLSHTNMLTLGTGTLKPVNIEELTANDKVVFSHKSYIKAIKLEAPAYQKIKVNVRDFAVPHRLLFPDFPDFMAQGPDGTLREPYTTFEDLYSVQEVDNVPIFKSGTLYDYFNLPTPPSSEAFDAFETNVSKGDVDTEIKLMPMLAFLKIYQDWYNDENFGHNFDLLFEQLPQLANYPYISQTDTWTDQEGTSHKVLGTLFNSATYTLWRSKDYFTSALPWQQKGGSVTINVGGQAPVHSVYTYNEGVGSWPLGAPMTNMFGSYADDVKPNPYDTTSQEIIDLNTGQVVGGRGTDLTQYADLSAATPMTVVEFRTRMACQQWLEANATGGTRWIETLRHRFGSKLPDAFAQRSLYLGGETDVMQIGDVYNTAQDTGDYSGKMELATRSGVRGFHAKEHCYFISIVTIQPMESYFQGIPKMYQRFSNFDLVNPEFARVGEQLIKSQELYYNWYNDAENNEDFGYTPRYADFKCHLNEIHGDFRGNLSYWHSSRIYDTHTSPALAPDFIQCDPTQAQRIFALDEDVADPLRMFVQIHFTKVTCLPYYGTPRV